MLFRSSLVAALSAAFLQSAAAEITTDVVGKSGKIKIFDDAAARGDRNAIMMTMDFLHEVDADGNAVGTGGSDKHGTNTFANQQFTFSDVEEAVYSNVTADYFSFEADVYSAGSIKIETYIFREDGVITTSANETFDVFAGDFKFSIELIDWMWCETCGNKQDEVGAFVDVGIELKGRNDEPTEDDLGGGIGVVLSSKILADDIIIDMPAGYPMIVSKDAFDLDGDGVEDKEGDGKKLFIFRFPKEGGAALYDYDPIVRTSAGDCGFFCRAIPC